MSDLVELKPCPFCGGPAEIVDIDEGENAGGSCVCCTSCLASGNVEFEFKENFVSNWNRRATDPEPSRLSALVAWQDIETAPKDGTRILIEFVHANAKFSPDPVGEGWIAVHEAYWLDHNAGGWTWYGLSGVATRWLPLPTPPVSQLKDTTNADK